MHSIPNEGPEVNGGGVNRPPINDPAQYENLSEATKEALACFIGLVMAPGDGVGPGDSYGMKHDFERAGGFYVNNGEFKGAMLAAGYEPVNRDEMNWRFRVEPVAFQQQPYLPEHDGGWPGHYPIPRGNPEGVKRLAALIDKALGRAA